MTNRILLVDDHEALTHGLSLVLQAEDYKVDAVHTGEAALRALEAHRFDVVLLDYSMSGMTGLEVMEQMRNRLNSTTPVVMISASEHIADECLMLGAHAFLTKPFTVDSLICVVGEICVAAPKSPCRQ